MSRSLHQGGVVRGAGDIWNYYTALPNAVECSIHLHGPSRLPAVNYFSIMTVAKHIMAVKESGFFLPLIHVFRFTPQAVR